jgi:2-polyprenyl-3-methyl-5-hydroxy-6-metoxy-1,4-benzoquinol methylase
MNMDIKKLNNELGNGDLILIDQILKNRFHKQMRILDAGCGEGRNMVYFIRNDFDIYGIDCDQDAVKMARFLGKSLNSSFEAENIQPFSVEDNPFPDHFFDAVLCINVLHAAKDRNGFYNMLEQLIRILVPGGFLFISMQSQIGLSVNHVGHNGDADGAVPDEDVFYLTNELLSEIIAHESLMEIEPFKTIIIDDKKSSTYLFIQKKG